MNKIQTIKLMETPFMRFPSSDRKKLPTGTGREIPKNRQVLL